MGVVWKSSYFLKKHGVAGLKTDSKRNEKTQLKSKNVGKHQWFVLSHPKTNRSRRRNAYRHIWTAAMTLRLKINKRKYQIGIQGCVPTCTHACCTGFYLRSLSVALLTWTCCDGAHYVSIFVSWKPPHTHTLYRPTLTGRAKCQTNWSEKSLRVCIKVRHGLGSYSWWDCAAIK